ncbi:unnamed protein product, partial [Ascophyllum nodosum]
KTPHDFCSSTCGDTFNHACGTLVRCIDNLYVTYHDQREQMAKVVPGRSLVISCGDSNWGTSVGPSEVGLRVFFFVPWFFPLLNPSLAKMSSAGYCHARF